MEEDTKPVNEVEYNFAMTGAVGEGTLLGVINPNEEADENFL